MKTNGNSPFPQEIKKLLISGDKEMRNLGNALLPNYIDSKTLKMLSSPDKEMVNLGITILAKDYSYDDMIILTNNLPHVTVFLMWNIFDGKMEWKIKDK